MTDAARHCAIVGAGAGLGRALAARFAREGYTLTLVSRSEAGSAAALEAARAASPNARHRFVAADAQAPESVETALSGGDGFDVMIYNARGGYMLREPLAMTAEELEAVYRLEVVGAHAAARAVMPGMIERGHGSVIFSSATAAMRGSGTNPLYAIGKFGLRALSQSLAKAYAAKGIHVVHVRLDCDLDVPDVRAWHGDKFDPTLTANCDDVADSYWWVHRQPRSAWSNEIELRPYTENWTY